MIALIKRLFTRAEPSILPALARNAAALAGLHASAFSRGWSEQEFERLLVERNVVADRAVIGGQLAGFIVSRMAADQAEILSVAVAGPQRGRGLAGRLLDRHLRRLAGLGVKVVFLEVDDDNVPARRLYAAARFRQVGRREGYYPRPQGAATALVLRRELV
jgi:ribosomal-protein-alanine N-acetyltransferase